MQYDSFEIASPDESPLDRAEPRAAGSPFAANVATKYSYRYTGDYRIDTLLDSIPGDLSVTSRWNHTQPLGTPVEVTYSFMTVDPNNGGSTGIDGAFGFSPFTAEQKRVANEIMQRVSSEIGITLTLIDDTEFSYGQIRFGNNNQSGSQTSGYAYLPNSTPDSRSGDIWLDNTYAPELISLPPGSPQLASMIHEIGHALGLKHPGNEPFTLDPGNFLGTAEDNYNYSVMSYNEVFALQERDWFGIYDLLALKALYGQRAYNPRDTYTFTNADGDILKVIDDAGGFDTFDVSQVTTGAYLDMRPGTFSSVGFDYLGRPAVGNVSIDFFTTMEYFIGTTQGDTIIVGSAAVSGDGGGGLDTVMFTSGPGGYAANASGGTVFVSGNGASNAFANVERVTFTGYKMAFDFGPGGNAGEAARILGTIFGQGDNPLPEYASVLLSYLDSGVTYEQLIDGAIDYQLGVNHSVTQLVLTIYANLSGGLAPSQQVLNEYTSLITSGQYTEAGFAVEAANSVYADSIVDFAGQATVGLVYA